MSAAADALFGVRDLDLHGTCLFLTHFPKIEDMKMILAVGVGTLYFFGNVNDPESIDLANSLSSTTLSLEMVKLE